MIEHPEPFGPWRTDLGDVERRARLRAMQPTAVMTLVPGTRAAERGSLWSASCDWSGQTFEARCRSGAAYKLCRLLVAAGIPDQPLQVFNAKGQIDLTFTSIHMAAGRRIVEGNRTPIANVPYAPIFRQNADGDGQDGALAFGGSQRTGPASRACTVRP